MNTPTLKTSLFALSLLSASCAYVPTSSPVIERNDGCEMITKELELKEEELIAGGGACQGPACAAVAIVPAATFVVSGSIVLIGNTVHWLEKNGTCSDGLVRSNLKSFQEWAFGEGGQTVQQ